MEFGRNKSGYVGEGKTRTLSEEQRGALDDAQFARIAIHPMFSCGGHSKSEYEADVKGVSYCLKGNGCPNFILGHGGACYKKTQLKTKRGSSDRSKCRCVELPFDSNGDLRKEMFHGKRPIDSADAEYEDARVWAR